MSMESVEKLLKELKMHPEAETLMKAYGKKDTLPEYAETILSVAQRLGIETQMDTEEIVSYLEEKESSIKAAADQTAEDIVALDDDDVKNVAGGFRKTRANCGKSHENTDECVFFDKCGRWWK